LAFYIYLTPCVPLSWSKERRRKFEKRGFAPLRRPVSKERGRKVGKRGFAPLRRPLRVKS